MINLNFGNFKPKKYFFIFKNLIGRGFVKEAKIPLNIKSFPNKGKRN